MIFAAEDPGPIQGFVLSKRTTCITQRRHLPAAIPSQHVPVVVNCYPLGCLTVVIFRFLNYSLLGEGVSWSPRLPTGLFWVW